MAKTLDDKINEMRRLMETQLRIKGRDFQRQVRRAGRLLPRRIRQDAKFIIDTAEVAKNPKLERMVDTAKVDKAYANIVRYLAGLDPRERMWTQIINVTASIALAFIVVIVVVIYVLVQRGFV